MELTSTKDIATFIHTKSVDLKPDELLLDDIMWKYLIRSVIRGQNVLITGPTGSGKTKTATWAAKALERPLYVFNMGSTQDPRSTLIGNTHYSVEAGTYFANSEFIRAIQTPNAIIVLDEVSRANPEAFNILMTVLDDTQRYIRIDDSPETPTIKVHPTVSFIGTANIGVEYSSTRVIDRALLDRFVVVNMEYLDFDGEVSLLSKKFPRVAPKDIHYIASIVGLIRSDVMSAEPNLSTSISTRYTIEMVSLIEDGFSMDDVINLIVYPMYSDEGGLESERVYVKQLVQSQTTDTNANDSDISSLFNTVKF